MFALHVIFVFFLHGLIYQHLVAVSREYKRTIASSEHYLVRRNWSCVDEGAEHISVRCFDNDQAEMITVIGPFTLFLEVVHAFVVHGVYVVSVYQRFKDFGGVPELQLLGKLLPQGDELLIGQNLGVEVVAWQLLNIILVSVFIVLVFNMLDDTLECIDVRLVLYQPIAIAKNDRITQLIILSARFIQFLIHFECGHVNATCCFFGGLHLAKRPSSLHIWEDLWFDITGDARL